MEPGRIIEVKLKKLAGGVIAKAGKRKITVTDSAGKSYVFKVSGRRSKVTVAGRKAKTGELKVGMNCDFRNFGVGDLARNITCK